MPMSCEASGLTVPITGWPFDAYVMWSKRVKCICNKMTHQYPCHRAKGLIASIIWWPVDAHFMWSRRSTCINCNKVTYQCACRGDRSYSRQTWACRHSTQQRCWHQAPWRTHCLGTWHKSSCQSPHRYQASALWSASVHERESTCCT